MARLAQKLREDETAAAGKKDHGDRQAAGGARGGLTAPVTPSAKLAAVVGKKHLPRSEAVSKVWEYIKKHDLQDPKDKRNIIADDKLKNVFGKGSATMFEMNKLFSAHLTSIRVK